ncbi:MAG: addiction module protein [Opitutaceae bacterium]|nr:addiction module protein [Opitutaceae bacterium]
MTSTAELVRLPVEERLALIDELWASIPAEALPADGKQLGKANTRLAELKANPAIGLTYEQLKTRLG